MKLEKINQKSNHVGADAPVLPFSNKGITLVALVVTIIVLIILAGVTLNIVLDQNGIIGKANEAAESWNGAVKKEETEIGGVLTYIDKLQSPIEKLNSIISDALAKANGDINLVNANDIKTALNEYDETAVIWVTRERKVAELDTESILTFEENNFWFIAYVKNNYYVLSKDTLNWKECDGPVFDGFVYYEKDITFNGLDHQDLLEFNFWGFPAQTEGWVCQDTGILYGRGDLENEDYLKFISYSNLNEFELTTEVFVNTSTFYPIEDALYPDKPYTRVAIRFWWPTGGSPGITCRCFMTEKNITTGEIRIKYSEVLRIRSEDIK